MPRKMIDSSWKNRTLREIIPPVNPEVRLPVTGITCPKCKGELTRGTVPCPEGEHNCRVKHQGLHCASCGKFWH